MQVLTDSDFATATASGVSFIDFFAEWCGPCKMLAPIFEELAGEYEGKAHFYKVNVDEAQEVAQKFSVTSIPTLILLENGEEKSRLTGFQSKDVLKSKLDEMLA